MPTETLRATNRSPPIAMFALKNAASLSLNVSYEMPAPFEEPMITHSPGLPKGTKTARGAGGSAGGTDSCGGPGIGAGAWRGGAGTEAPGAGGVAACSTGDAGGSVGEGADGSGGGSTSGPGDGAD